MSKRFEAFATGLDNVPYRVDIYDTRYGTPVSEVADGRGFIRWNVGEGDDTNLRPIKPHEFRLSFIQTQDLSVLTDAAEDDIRVEIFRTDTSTLVYKGYIAPNEFEDRPLGAQPDRVELQGTEGLPLLQDQTVDSLSWSGDAEVSMMKVIRTVLNQLYPTPLPIEIGMHWFPAGVTDDTKLPLQERNVIPGSFRDDRPNGGQWWTLYKTLQTLLRKSGLVIQQTRRLSDVAWWISQWDAYKSDGHIDTWKVQPGGTTTYRGDQDVVVDLNPILDAGQAELDHSRSPERQRKRVTVTYDHPPAENFLNEPGFEDGGTDWAIDDTVVMDAFVSDHANFSETPDPTTDNQKVALMRYDSDSGNGSNVFPFEQGGILLVRPEKDAFLRLSIAGSEDITFTYRARIENGGTYFTDTSTSVRADTLQGEVELPVEPIDAPIAKGQRLTIREGLAFQSFFEVTEQAKAGDELITGRLEQSIQTPANLWYIKPVGSSDVIRLNLFTKLGNRTNWRRWSVSMPFQDQNGDRLSDTVMSLELGVKKSSLFNGNLEWLFDDVRLQPIKGGKVLDQTVSEATDGNIGEVDEIETETGSGPTQSTISRIVGGLQWGIGASPTNTWPISELNARQRLRYFRGQNQRQELTPLVEEKTPQIIGHETVDIDGTIYRVVSTEYDVTEGTNTIALLEHQDFGTS